METLIQNNATLNFSDGCRPERVEGAQELKLKNYNNSLSCDAFLYIQQAPARQVVDVDFEKVFFTWHEGKEIFFKLVDILRFEFSRMPSIATLPATGMESTEWCHWWKKEHPDVSEKTLMAVYYYRKIRA